MINKIWNKNSAEVTLQISSKVVGDFNDKINFPHKLLLANTQVSRPRKVFANNSSTNIKLSKTEMLKIGQSGEFLGRLLGPLLKTWLSLIGNVLKPLAKGFLIPLGLIAAASTKDAAIHKNMFWSGVTKLINLNEEMKNIMKIVKFPEESGLLIKGVSKPIENEAKKQNWGFFGMSLGSLGASSLGIC